MSSDPYSARVRELFEKPEHAGTGEGGRTARVDDQGAGRADHRADGNALDYRIQTTTAGRPSAASTGGATRGASAEDKGRVHFAPVARILARFAAFFCLAQLLYLTYALVDAVVDHCFPLLESYGDTLEEIESVVVENVDTELLKRIHVIKRWRERRRRRQERMAAPADPDGVTPDEVPRAGS